ncbi:MAG: hypothetical protein AAF577_07445 [Pseudomonadota bacterium]
MRLSEDARSILGSMKLYRSLAAGELEEMEKTIGCAFPSELREMYVLFDVRNDYAIGVSNTDEPAAGSAVEVRFSNHKEYHGVLEILRDVGNFNDVFGKYIIFGDNGIGYHFVCNCTGTEFFTVEGLYEGMMELRYVASSLSELLVKVRSGPILDEYELQCCDDNQAEAKLQPRRKGGSKGKRARVDQRP